MTATTDAPGAALAAVQSVLDRLTSTVTGARAVPLSASCVVNRAEVLGLIDELRAGLPSALDQAHDVLEDRAAVVQDGRREAERVVATAQVERGRLLEDTEVLRQAEVEAARIRQEAAEAAEITRVEAEDYVDAKLATFEVVLTRTLEAVERGRQEMGGELAGRSGLEGLTGDLHGDHDDRPLPG